MEEIIDQIIEGSGLSKSALAARSGLARSTQYRIRDGLVDPTLGSLRELALAAGFELVLSLAPLSDPDAARAARVILDPRFEASYVLSGGSKEVDAWVERLRRWVPGGDPVDIVWQAGQSSSLLHRRGTVFLRGNVTELKLASAGDFSQQEWFLSGAAVIDRIGEPDDDGALYGGALPGTSASPYIVHSADTHRFARLLDNMEEVRPNKANLIIAEHTDGVGVDSWEDGKIKLVAPIQGLIDAFGIGGALGQAAERIARSW
ncbi:hypothetical protein [Cryobacterium fucosi]|uniref:XRE family transcriptional regulator n=1 Tax=Cryobacterium fucosi TaxID=1259157 RepID=A0A4R9B730_9MICO|nr:hypothetical protein [Cryobacterium fucosi]TFD75655.1 hypothetical protein E3T48_11385 [Cryobacterium fucosi]